MSGKQFGDLDQTSMTHETKIVVYCCNRLEEEAFPQNTATTN